MIEAPRGTALIWIVPAAMLLVAPLPLPFGYYTLLRLVVCTAAGWLAYDEHRRRASWCRWSLGLVGIALLFNPVAPVPFGRSTWAPIDVGASAVFVLHWWRVSGRSP
jgi:hypothetical protein